MTEHTVALLTMDGQERAFPAQPEQSVVEAALAAGTVIPSLCHKGTCGTCVGQVRRGEYRSRPFEAEALGRSAGENAVLLCCCEPVSDLVVELAYESTRLIDRAPAQRSGIITSLERITPEIVRLRVTLEPDELTGAAAEFEAGQFMQLAEPQTGVLRAYSMSNVANWDGELEFLIHLRAGGVFSAYLGDRAAEGDRLRVVGPQGTFALEENGLRPRWFVGGGCGLAPLLSMMRRMGEWADPQPTCLVLGVNRPSDVFALDAVREVMSQLPQLEVTIAVWHSDSDLPEDEPGLRYVAGSSVDVLRAALTADPEQECPDIYVCGPPAMVVALEDAVADLSVPADRVHVERITQN